MGNKNSFQIDSFELEESLLSKGTSTQKHIFPTFKKNLKEFYSIKKSIGRGGFGEVYSVLHKESGEIRVLKVIKKEKLGKNVISCLVNEVEFLRQCGSHPNICKLFDGFEDRSKVCLIMEKCSGGELLERISNPKLRLSESEIAEVIAQTIGTLKALHARRIVHCDLKPENILFRDRKSNNIVLIDFGLSQRCGKFDFLKKVAGTPSYIAPELLTKHYTSECDIYAVGIICFECFHGYLPWTPKKSPIETIKQAKAGFKGETKPGRGPWFNSKVEMSDEAKDFIKKCLDLDATKRVTAKEAQIHKFLSSKTKVLTPFVEVTSGFSADNIHLNTLDTFVARLIHPEHTLPEKLLKEAALVFQKVAVEEGSDNDMIKWDGFQKAVEEVTKSHIPQAALHSLFDHFDLDGDHEISCEEFLKICAMQYSRTEDARFNKMLISIFDPKGNGYISLDYLKDTLVEESHLRKEITDQVVASLEEVSKKGKISYIDFAKALDEETERDASFQLKVIDVHQEESKLKN